MYVVIPSPGTFHVCAVNSVSESQVGITWKLLRDMTATKIPYIITGIKQLVNPVAGSGISTKLVIAAGWLTERHHSVGIGGYEHKL